MPFFGVCTVNDGMVIFILFPHAWGDHPGGKFNQYIIHINIIRIILYMTKNQLEIDNYSDVV